MIITLTNYLFKHYRLTNMLVHTTTYASYIYKDKQTKVPCITGEDSTIKIDFSADYHGPDYFVIQFFLQASTSASELRPEKRSS